MLHEVRWEPEHWPKAVVRVVGHSIAMDGELLPKSDILESQLATSLEGRDESGNKRRNHAGMVLADRRLFKFGARG